MDEEVLGSTVVYLCFVIWHKLVTQIRADYHIAAMQSTKCSAQINANGYTGCLKTMYKFEWKAE